MFLRPVCRSICVYECRRTRDPPRTCGVSPSTRDPPRTCDVPPSTRDPPMTCGVPPRTHVPPMTCVPPWTRLCTLLGHRDHVGCLKRFLGTQGPVDTAVHNSRVQLKRLGDLERHLKRKLRSVHQRFADVADSDVIVGRRHVYTADGREIYRRAHGLGGAAVPVLCADWAGGVSGTIQRVRLSPTEAVLAASVKDAHSEQARCMLVRLEHSAVPREPLLTLDKVFSFEWASDDVLVYTTQEELQCRHVFKLHLTDTGADTTLVYEENDPEFFVEVSRSRDQRLLTVNCSSKRSCEVWLIDSRAPLSPPRLVHPRQPGLLYHVEHAGGQLYILANTGPAQEYQVLRAPLGSPDMQHWESVFSPEPGAVIKDMEVLQEHCVCTVREPQGRLQLHTIPLRAPNRVAIVQLPAWACAIEPQRVSVEDGDVFTFLLSSPVHPPVRYVLSPTEQQSLSREDDPQHAALPACHTTRLWARSQDGTAVPVTLFHTRALAELRHAPLLLHVYGAYGLDLNMHFSPEKRFLLDRAWVLAYCHVRGGGECGLSWHRAGRLQFKPKGVEDLVASVLTLFRSGVSRPALTALTARSAGAVLAGALCNQHPQLLRAVLLQAPFLDVLGTMLDPSLPLTVEERGEWGDPLTDPQQRDDIAAYCPYQNITPQLYPSVLITAYAADTRVPVSGVLRYVERLRRAVQTHTSNLGRSEHHPAVLLDLQDGGDHFGPEDFDQSLSESARQIAFLYSALGLDNQGSRPTRTR
ncbi:prolyl endopeptidase-like [Brachyhypopomus gauderio]|uniref:prolyl endopeptidase-like n=1 Tax=Brachyhypopomus gauderio TaxID=698409 RepID=UPI0040424B63